MIRLSPLQDVMTATRVGRPLTECGPELQPNAERHLRTRLRLARTFPVELLGETMRVAERCSFSLDELRYQYPDEVVPQGELRRVPAPADLRRGRKTLAPGYAGEGADAE